MTKASMTGDELAELIEQFPPLDCWKVGLAYGSAVYFDMGERLRESALDGSYRYVGSSELWLYGYHWTIYHDDFKVMTADRVSQKFTESVIAPKFIGQRLTGMAVDEERCSISVIFSGGLRTVVWREDDDELTDEYALIVLFLPDGRIICFNASHGLHVSDEIVSDRAERWENRGHKGIH